MESKISAISLVDKIDEIVQTKSLLKHPFYQRWSKGELTESQLSGYAREYFHLVKTIPDLVRNIAIALNARNLGKKGTDSLDISISSNLREEEEHVELWRRFAASLGVGREEIDSHIASRKTIDAVSELISLSKHSFDEAIASMYAYESALPEISRSKTKGLREFYGLDSKDSTIYFETHEKADVIHASLWRGILEKLPSDRHKATLSAATNSMEAQNMLLDSVMERYVGSPS